MLAWFKTLLYDSPLPLQLPRHQAITRSYKRGGGGAADLYHGSQWSKGSLRSSWAMASVNKQDGQRSSRRILMSLPYGGCSGENESFQVSRCTYVELAYPIHVLVRRSTCIEHSLVTLKQLLACFTSLFCDIISMPELMIWKSMLILRVAHSQGTSHLTCLFSFQRCELGSVNMSSLLKSSSVL